MHVRLVPVASAPPCSLKTRRPLSTYPAFFGFFAALSARLAPPLFFVAGSGFGFRFRFEPPRPSGERSSASASESPPPPTSSGPSSSSSARPPVAWPCARVLLLPPARSPGPADGWPDGGRGSSAAMSRSLAPLMRCCSAVLPPRSGWLLRLKRLTALLIAVSSAHSPTPSRARASSKARASMPLVSKI